MSKSETNTKREMRQTARRQILREMAPAYGRKRPTYDLEERTFAFARVVRSLMRLLPRTLSHEEDGRQLLRSSGSVGANYIEANESLGKQDFLMHIKIARKEAKESRYWLRLLTLDGDVDTSRNALITESTELMNILGAILQKSR